MLPSVPISQPSSEQAWTESSFSLLFRTLQQNADNEKWLSLESEVALAKTLRRYLPYLGLLSQAPASNAHPKIEHETRPVKVMIQPVAGIVFLPACPSGADILAE